MQAHNLTTWVRSPPAQRSRRLGLLRFPRKTPATHVDTGVLLYNDLTRAGSGCGKLGGMTLTDSAPLVTLYSQPGCGPCVGVASYLTASNIPFEKRDITKDEAAYARVVELGYSGTPVIEHPEGHFKGYDPEKLESIKVALFAGV